MARSMPDGLIAHHALADLHPLQQPDRLELVHHAVDARARDLALARAQGLLDLDRRQCAGLLVEQFENRPTGAPSPVACARERLCGLLGPGVRMWDRGHRGIVGAPAIAASDPLPGAGLASGLRAPIPATARSCPTPE